MPVAKGGHLEVLRELSARGLRLEPHGVNALEVAEREEHEELAAYLRAHWPVN